jgi:hypothetical protein
VYVNKDSDLTTAEITITLVGSGLVVVADDFVS